MNRASPVDLRKSLEMANSLAQIGIRFVPIPVATEEEFQALVARVHNKLNQLVIERRRMKGVQRETRHYRRRQRA